jgi:succinate dehydrogenase / fumarate reductase cytochrome b subunit
MNMLLRPVRSSLGSKYLMALTGLALIGFVLVHMGGNLLVYAGRDALNSYAANLKAHPAVLWAARAGLLAVFVLHVALGIRLTRQNYLARPVRYQYPDDTLQASWASRHMFLTGMVLLAFVLYHLAHFTFGILALAPEGSPGEETYVPYNSLAEYRRPADPKWQTAPPSLGKGGQLPAGWEERHDVYAMVVAGFRNPWITLSYLVAMVFLGLHLWHGGSSWFQSLGLNHARYNKLIRGFGPVLAAVVVAGNCSIPLSVYLGIVK